MFSYISGHLKSGSSLPQQLAGMDLSSPEAANIIERIEIDAQLRPFDPKHFFIGADGALDIHPDVYAHLQTHTIHFDHPTAPDYSGCPAMYATYTDETGRKQSNIILDWLNMVSRAYAVHKQNQEKKG